MFGRMVVSSCCIWIACIAVGQGDVTPWTVDDLVLAESASQFVIAPDGEWTVYVKTAMDKKKGRRVSNLVLRSLVDDTEIQLTRGTNTHQNPQWAPGGKHISFLSDRELPESKKGNNVAKTQLWLMNPRGGEPWPLTNTKRTIKGYDWVDDDSIAFLAQEAPTLYEQEIIEKEDTSNVVEDTRHEPPVRLFTISIDSSDITRVTTNSDWMEELWVSPDGTRVVTRNAVSLSFEFDNKNPPATYLIDLRTGDSEQLFQGERFEIGHVAWQPDSSAFYFTTRFSTDPLYTTAAVQRLYYYPLGAGGPRRVDLDWDRSLGSGTIYAASFGFVGLLADGVYFRPARYTRRGNTWVRNMIGGDHVPNIANLVLGDDGETAVYLYSTASLPGDWQAAELRGSVLSNAHSITALNKSFQDKPKPKTEVLHWTGARGDTVEGILHYPLNYKEGTRYPTSLVIHGGPAGVDLDAWRDGWSSPKVLLAQEGIAVLQVNYHGSANYGLEWLESIGGGDYYALPRVDLESGIDYLIERGIADPDKLATMGWSNGSILSIDLVVHNSRYKAISAGAGDVDWISDWGNVDFGASFDNYYFGGSPWENLTWYLENSPFFKLDQVVAPTIIYFGTEDRNVPPSQGWSHFRALQQFGKTDVKFVLFPGEPHGLGKYQHQKRKVEEDLNWFRQHLLGQEVSVPSVKEGSRLDVALKSQKFAKAEGVYGRRENGMLIPELVSYKDFQIGRFEVTRAQFKAFDSAYSYPVGTDNYPANGITFERAQAYAEWLAKATGKPYRLGTEEEMKAVYSGEKGKGNTLNHWAGYDPNPEDTARLHEAAAKLSGDAPLLHRVGSFPPLEDDVFIFDLGGNVAEWVVDENGAGKLLGGSADRASDPQSNGLASDAYRGLRIVMGAGNATSLQ